MWLKEIGNKPLELVRPNQTNKPTYWKFAIDWLKGRGIIIEGSWWSWS